MPVKPRHPCNHPGCPALSSERFCQEHQKEDRRRYDQSRGTRTERGYSNRWLRYAKLYLSNHPLCVHHYRQGILVPATQVDHIKPINGPDDPLFWKEDNHQGLCDSCHSKKTATEDGGFGR